MKLAPIVDRLKEVGLVRVYGALEFAALKHRPERLPAYYVLPEGWNAAPNSTIGAHDQKTAQAFGVVAMLEGAARNDDHVSDALDEAERAILGALVGWRHPEMTGPCNAAGGRLVSVDGSTLSWIVRFSAGGRLRKAS